MELKDGWENILDRYDVRWVLFPSASSFTRALERTPGWDVAYQDRVATVLKRSAE